MKLREVASIVVFCFVVFSWVCIAVDSGNDSHESNSGKDVIEVAN